jgi:peroxiredoxin
MRLHAIFRSAGLSVLILVAASAALFVTSPACLAGEGTTSSLLGKPVPDFKLADTEGKEHSPSQYLSGKGVVLIFVSTRCPVSNAYNERMIKLAAEYQAKGFQFLGINANKAEDTTEMASHAKNNKWNFPVLKDAGNVVADKLNASVTPEVYVLDPAGILRYHGRIDDSQDPALVKIEDLKAALDALLGSHEVAKKESKAFGCSIKRV